MRQASAVKKPAVKSRTPKNRIENSLGTSGSKDAYFQQVQEKAYQLFLERGCAHGYDVEDWIKAEQLVKGE